MKPRGTTIPALVSGLTDLATRAVGPVQVINGPRGAQNLEADVLFIALTPAGAEAVSVTSAAARGLGSRPAETFTTWCLISCYHGDDDVQGLYDRAGAILDKLEAGLLADRALPNVADELAIGPDLTWTPAHFKDGVALEISFCITGRVLR